MEAGKRLWLWWFAGLVTAAGGVAGATLLDFQSLTLDAIAIRAGTLRSGGQFQLLSSDDQYLLVASEERGNIDTVIVTFDFTSPRNRGSSLEALLETGVNVNGVTTTIHAFNDEDNRFVRLVSFGQARADCIHLLTIDERVAEFIDEDRKVRLKLTMTRDGGPFRARIDLVRMLVEHG